LGRWAFGGYEVEQNPSTDTGWVPEVRVAELEVAGGPGVLQVDGVRAERRQVAFRSISEAQLAALRSVYVAGRPVAVRDDTGAVRNAVITRWQTRRRPAGGAWNRWDLELELYAV
jgi:hypothetical protein